MVSKTITIKENVYLKLLKLKRQKESFSDLLERLAEAEKPLMILNELRGTIDLGDTRSLIEEIKSKRENWRS